jgi:hypothetical protein
MQSPPHHGEPPCLESREEGESRLLRMQHPARGFEISDPEESLNAFVHRDRAAGLQYSPTADAASWAATWAIFDRHLS